MSSRPARAVAATVLVAFLAFGALGQAIEVPTVFGDELIYFDAQRSLAEDGALSVRGQPYAFGPVYPVLTAVLHLGVDELLAYRLVKLLGAAAFALAAIPVYLLARRVLPAGWSAAAAALAVAVPSAVYTGFVMTESVAYACSCLALLLGARMLESPTRRRQLAAVLGVVAAAGVRPQLAVLGVALLAALPVRWWAVHGLRRPAAPALRRLAPLGGVCAVAAAVAAVRIVGDGSVLGGYEDLGRSYAPGEVARWSVYALAGLVLYLGVVPAVAAGPSLAGLFRAARRGERATAALLALTATVTVLLVAVVGAFSSTEFGVGFLHDRYLFYAAPLWIVVLLCFVTRVGPLPQVPLAISAAAVLALLAVLPTYLLTRDGGRQFDATATGLLGHLAGWAGYPAPPRWLLLVVGLAAVAVTLAPGRWRRGLVVVVGAAFLANSALVWSARIDSGRDPVFASAPQALTWVDRAAADGGPVALLSGEVDVTTRDALRLTEFFNSRVGAVYDFGVGFAPTLSSTRVAATDDRVLRRVDGEAIPERLVVTPAALELEGRRLAVGAGGRLSLWQIRGAAPRLRRPPDPEGGSTGAGESARS